MPLAKFSLKNKKPHESYAHDSCGFKSKKKNFCSESKGSSTKLPLQVKLQDGFTVLLMTETKFGTILTLENNTNPFELLGNCRSCR